jgi:hypothetical protein
VVVLSTISTALLAWIGCMATGQRDALEASVKTSQLALSQQAEERQRLAGQRDVNLKVYEAVVGAIQDGSQRRQEIARSLVYAMVPDTSLQQGFLEALRQEGVASVRQVVARDLAFDDSTRQTRAAASAGRDRNAVYRIDLFWCEKSGQAAQNLMQQVARRLAQAGLAAGGIRVRNLPATVNERPGYYVSGYQVRFEADERGDGEKIRDAIRSAVPGASDQTVALLQIPAQTPGYISAFACPRGAAQQDAARPPDLRD